VQKNQLQREKKRSSAEYIYIYINYRANTVSNINKNNRCSF